MSGTFTYIWLIFMVFMYANIFHILHKSYGWCRRCSSNSFCEAERNVAEAKLPWVPVVCRTSSLKVMVWGGTTFMFGDLDLRYVGFEVLNRNIWCIEFDELEVWEFFSCVSDFFVIFRHFKNQRKTPTHFEACKKPHDLKTISRGQGADWGVCDSEEDPILAGSFPICLATQNMFLLLTAPGTRLGLVSRLTSLRYPRCPFKCNQDLWIRALQPSQLKHKKW